MNSNEKCVIKNYKDAIAVFENTRWTDVESALLYYWYFREEKLVDDLRESLNDPKNHKDFISLVKKLKGKIKYKLVGEKK